jgi:hypothetical protein
MMGVIEYQLMVADDASFTSPIVAISVNNTGYVMTEELEYGNTYFWRVRSLLPIEGAWSTVASFTIKKAPSEASPSVIVQSPTLTQQIVLTLAPSGQPSIDPIFIWVIIGIGSILVIAILILIIKTAS